MQCRINKRREWTTRQFLESTCHEANSFVTLTYSDQFVPHGNTLRPDDLVLFIKRLRSALDYGGRPKVRFFACGEYGDKTQRPHYHLSLFGLSPLDASYVEQAWRKGKASLGFTDVQDFTPKTAAYVGGYVTKKLTRRGDRRLAGKAPEFARQSRVPGLGANALHVIVDAIATDAGLAELDRMGDVPMALKMGNSTMPLGRYLREQLRNQISMPDHVRERIKARWAAECMELVRALRVQQDPDYAEWEKALQLLDAQTVKRLSLQFLDSAASVIEKKNVQHHRNLEAREAIQRSKRTL